MLPRESGVMPWLMCFLSAGVFVVFVVCCVCSFPAADFGTTSRVFRYLVARWTLRWLLLAQIAIKHNKHWSTARLALIARSRPQLRDNTSGVLDSSVGSVGSLDASLAVACSLNKSQRLQRELSCNPLRVRR
jgi:hypothetical protein